MIVLASASPRRSEIMTLMGLDFITHPASKEKNPSTELQPEEYTALSALYKAQDVAIRFKKEDIIIGADTVVALDGIILGKPKDEEDARRMLRMLSGKTHRVYTGFAILRGETVITGCEYTDVDFRELTDIEIDNYVKTGESMDKAGAYGIQGRGCVNITGIRGDYFNVMGLPACRIHKELSKLYSV